MRITKFFQIPSKIIIIAILLVSISACQNNLTKSGNQSNEEIKGDQGITGEVLWFEGNLMPGPNKKMPSGKPVVKEIFIYELTGKAQTKFDGQFFSEIKTDLISQIKSDENGKFKIALPSGKYSLFVKEPNGFFANSFDGEGHINPIEVEPGKYTNCILKIDYQAAY
ncbi:hypothetical protein [Flexithrix dorotheae]|uniref:hypothetical protein n=1 Tax=Flexithrix dorotheae TaxID=70993 RepID=UPI00036CCB71|nr:hypothetical protein [Flexithrix dorotheae]